MFRIRRIYDYIVPANRDAIEQARSIFRQQFAGAPLEDIDDLPDRLSNPFKKRFSTMLYIAEDSRRRVVGFATVLHDPVVRLSFLDYIASIRAGRGIGAALYEHVRNDAHERDDHFVVFECLPDDSKKCRDPELRKQNVSRLRFYERYGARPVVGTAYETPVPGGDDDCLPYLMFDTLNRGATIDVRLARKVVRAIFERKYDHCPPDYVDRVCASFRDPVELRPFQYVRSAGAKQPPSRLDHPIPMTVNDRHDIHHVRERGYVESPVRIRAILDQLEPAGLVRRIQVRNHPMSRIEAVHDKAFVAYLRRACAETPEGVSVYPYVFPIRNATRPPRDLSVRAGYYAIDTFTPINRNAYIAARRAVDCTLTAADQILGGERLAYALVRPPGHHAEQRTFGGFCYFNNAAVAAEAMSAQGRVAMLDIDYHHGNGQQDIFYQRSDVFTVSIHGSPDYAYPYFTGFADERGDGPGEGFNLNVPLPEVQNGRQYAGALKRTLREIETFDPMFLIVSLGLDTAKGDPTGTWSLSGKDMEHNGRMIGELGIPTLVVQEGGYRTRTLGMNARSFFHGLMAGAKR